MCDWISVNDQLPDDNECVIVYIHTWFESWYKGGVFFDADGVDCFSGVTHWMRISKPNVKQVNYE